jgi:hypothetical protein
MRWPRVRFTVRRMMIAVAALAALLGIARSFLGMARERQYRFRKLAGDYAAQAQALGVGTRIPVNLGRPQLVLTHLGKILEDSPETLRLERRYWWLRDMSAKYEQAARLPLLPVTPDPPEP